MSIRRTSILSSAPMQTDSIEPWGPTICSSAWTNSSASRPWVTRTRPIMDFLWLRSQKYSALSGGGAQCPEPNAVATWLSRRSQPVNRGPDASRSRGMSRVHLHQRKGTAQHFEAAHRKIGQAFDGAEGREPDGEAKHR